ncbi:hypothetical protein [Aromatoleum tolulyticum]|uniref:hypothetical protein n=1 Tax=Aromatoleum tolulyticum TaxID=34027 RepID=UPI001BAF309D|nr:hypothetical protein [Aromatoleum tolulyticum]
MALIDCPECKRQISDMASSCIHCGYPIDSVTTISGPKETPKSLGLLAGNPNFDSDAIDDVRHQTSQPPPKPEIIINYFGVFSLGLGAASIVVPYFAAVFFVPVALICGFVSIWQKKKLLGVIGIVLSIVGIVRIVDISNELHEAQRNVEKSIQQLKQIRP